MNSILNNIQKDLSQPRELNDGRLYRAWGRSNLPDRPALSPEVVADQYNGGATSFVQSSSTPFGYTQFNFPYNSTNPTRASTPEEIINKLVKAFPKETGDQDPYSAAKGADALKQALRAKSTGRLSRNDRIAINALLRDNAGELSNMFPGDDARVFNRMLGQIGFEGIKVQENYASNTSFGDFDLRGGSNQQGGSKASRIIGGFANAAGRFLRGFWS